MTISRGIRNNNPGNIERGQKWQGLADSHEMTPEQKAEKRFAVFRSPEWGIRAIVRILQTYNAKYKIDTIKGVINRWAPPGENNTPAYVKAVADGMGVDQDEHIELADPEVLRPLVKAIVMHENGQQPYGDAVIMAGIALAGLKAPKAKPLLKSKRVIGTAATVGAPGAIVALGQGRAVLDAAKSAVNTVSPGLANDGWGIALVIGLAFAAFVGFTLFTVLIDYKAPKMAEAEE